MGTIDDISKKVIDGDAKNFEREKSNLRVAILQLLCSENMKTKEEEEAKENDNVTISLVGKAISQENEKKFLLDWKWFQLKGIKFCFWIKGWLILLWSIFVSCGLLSIIIIDFNSTNCISFLQ